LTRRAAKDGSEANGVTNGFVNGSGAVNGFRLSYQQRRVAGTRVDLTKKLLVVVVLVAIIVAIPYALVYAFPKDSVQIDGYFMDWSKAQVYRQEPDSSNPDIALTAYAVKYDYRGSFFYIATEGQVLQGSDNGADGFYIFIDRDNNQSSGYSVRGLGADALVAVVGWNGSAITSKSYAFQTDADRLDFAGFEFVSNAPVASYGGEMEIGSSISLSDSSEIAICAKHTNITNDWSDVNFRTKGSALEVVENLSMPSVLSIAPDQLILTVELSAKGPQAAIQGLKFDFLGNVTPNSIRAVEGQNELGASNQELLRFDTPIVVGEKTRIIDILATLPSSVSEGTFGMQLNSTDAIYADRNVSWVFRSVQTGSRIAYVGSAPGSIVIDGAFGDWSQTASISDSLNDAYSSKAGDYTSGDVDISNVKAASTLGTASFYMSVKGTMLGGSSVPASMVRFVTPGPPAQNVTNITERMLGADFAFVFIDTDHNQSTGYSVGGSEVSIAVVGKDNSILSSLAYRYASGSWIEIGPVEAAIDSYQLELSSSYLTLGLMPGETYSMTMVAQDWSGRQDEVDLPLPTGIAPGSRAYGGILINEVFSRAPITQNNDWIELYNTGTTAIDITGWKLFYYDATVPGWVLTYTWPSVTIQPGTFCLSPYLNFKKFTDYVLTNESGSIIDSVSCPTWQDKSYGRNGSAPYSTWAPMTPTPGAVNVGQNPIPEFGDLILPVAIVPILLIAIRRAKSAKKSSDD